VAVVIEHYGGVEAIQTPLVTCILQKLGALAEKGFIFERAEKGFGEEQRYVEAWRSQGIRLACEGKLRRRKWWKLFCVGDSWVLVMRVKRQRFGA
jgi:hypothetical protein